MTVTTEAGSKPDEGAASDISAAGKLRRQVLEHLLELWYSQDETIKLSAQWTRYEKVTSDAREAARSAMSKHDEDTAGGLNAAFEAIDAMEGLSDDQRFLALSSALNDARPDEQEDGYATAAFKRVRLRRKDLGLLSAQLVTLVADFELFVLRVTTAWLEYDSNHLDTRKRELTFRDLADFSSLSELRESMVQSFLEELMRKSARAWFGEFCKLFGVPAIAGSDDFTTQEVFQRRHVIVHHGGIVSRQYLDNLRSFPVGVDLGEDLPVDYDYITRAADALAAVAHSIALSALVVSSRANKEREELDSETAELTYILLNLGRQQVVERFVDNFDVARVQRQSSRELIRVNGWIAKRRLGKLDVVRPAIEAWDVSGLSDKFQLAKLVLMEDAEAVAMAKQMRSEGRLTTYEIAVWPLFEDVRHSILTDMEPAAPEGPADRADAAQDDSAPDAS